MVFVVLDDLWDVFQTPIRPLLNSASRPTRQMLLIQPLPQQSLDRRLSADVQLPCRLIQLPRHLFTLAHIEPSYRIESKPNSW